jgi:hypothetical protein
VLVSGMEDPCGRGVRTEFERFGVDGPVGVEPSAGEPPGAPGEVAPPVVPELVPPDPDVWALAAPKETTTAIAAMRNLS